MATRVMIVEDENLIADNLASSLRKSGYDVSGISRSGEDALESISALKPDVILMDIRLAGKMDGINTAETLRAHFSIPVIFLTAHADSKLLDRAKCTQPSGYLVKPIRQVDLVSAIEVATYRHQMERKVKQRDAWLATTLRCAGDAVIVTDATGRIEFWNDLAKLVLNIPDNDVVGQKLCDVMLLKSRFTSIPAEDLVPLAVLQGNTMSIGSDLMYVDPFQQQKDIEGELAPCTVDGAMVGTVFTFRDVTIRNYQEDQRKRNLGSRASARLAGAVVTELRNLLTSAIEDNTRAQCDDETSSLLPQIMTAPLETSVKRLVSQLNLVRHKAVSFPAKFNLNALASAVCAEFRANLRCGVELVCKSQADQYIVYADPLQIKNAISNMLLYAHDAMPSDGSIYLTTSTSSYERRGRTGLLESYVTLTIANTSSGIEAHDAHHLFEPFSNSSHSQNGLDLRLYMVHEIIGDAGGSIRAQVKPDQGLSFELVLPRSFDKYIDELLPKDKGGPLPDNKAILLISANSDVRCLLAERLEKEHFHTLEARDIGEALQWMNLYNGSIHLLIVDLNLADIDATELLDHALIRHPGMKIILPADSSTTPANMKIWTENGARVLERPFRWEPLLGILKEWYTDHLPEVIHA